MDVETDVMVSVPLPCTASRGFASVKRPRTDEDQRPVNSRDGFHDHTSDSGWFFKRPELPSRKFLTIRASGLIFESEDFRPKGETLYTPLQEDVIVNTRNIEQFTFANGSFFIGDESSRFSRTVQGVCLNMWRFDDQTKKLFISRSFVFSNPQEAQGIKRVLEAM